MPETNDYLRGPWPDEAGYHLMARELASYVPALCDEIDRLHAELAAERAAHENTQRELGELTDRALAAGWAAVIDRIEREATDGH